MNDADLEAELRALTPRRMSPRLEQLIADAELSHPAMPSPGALRAASTYGRDPAPRPHARRSEGSRFILQRVIGWGVAATVLFAIVAGSFLSSPPPKEPRAAVLALDPSNSDTVVLQTSDEGLVTLADGSSARRYRVRSLDTIVWTDPQSNASLRWTVPREDVQVVPVSIF